MDEKKILIVDDDPDYSQLLEINLKKKGFQVTCASNGEEGLEQIGKEKPELVILDIKMPKMDGYTFVRQLKKNPQTKDITLVVLTAYEPMKDMFKLEGVSGFFLKSGSMKDLLTMVEKNLRGEGPS